MNETMTSLRQGTTARRTSVLGIAIAAALALPMTADAFEVTPAMKT